MASAQDKTATLTLHDKAVLALQVPAGATLVSSNGYVKVHTGNMTLHVWAVPKARTAQAAVGRAAEIIKSEFVNFTVTETKSLSIAGEPARHVLGSGNEADDGDPGHAEVVFFVVGRHVFAGCVHGEFDDAARERAPMMAVLQTASAPK